MRQVPDDAFAFGHWVQGQHRLRSPGAAGKSINRPVEQFEFHPHLCI
jgi:hypothetical protein